jgi:hypothetical protein
MDTTEWPRRGDGPVVRAWTFKQALSIGKRLLQRGKGRTRRQEVARSQVKPGVRATPIMETSLSEAPNIVGPRARIVKSVAISSIRRRGLSHGANHRACVRGADFKANGFLCPDRPHFDFVCSSKISASRRWSFASE